MPVKFSLLNIEELELIFSILSMSTFSNLSRSFSREDIEFLISKK